MIPYLHSKLHRLYRLIEWDLIVFRMKFYWVFLRRPRRWITRAWSDTRWFLKWHVLARIMRNTVGQLITESTFESVYGWRWNILRWMACQEWLPNVDYYPEPDEPDDDLLKVQAMERAGEAYYMAMGFDDEPDMWMPRHCPDCRRTNLQTEWAKEYETHIWKCLDCGHKEIAA